MGTVIKVGETGPILSRLSTVDLADHLAKAQAIIEDARRQADQIAAAAEFEADRLRQDARETGFQEGFEEGRREGTLAGCREGLEKSLERYESENATIVSVIEEALAGIEADKEELRIAAERDLFDFAVSVARQLTFESGRRDHEAAQANLRRALHLVEARTDLTISVHPDDLAAIETFAAAVLRPAEDAANTKVVADRALARGGCIVRRGETEVDASLETQVNEMVGLLLGGRATNA